MSYKLLYYGFEYRKNKPAQSRHEVQEFCGYYDFLTYFRLVFHLDLVTGKDIQGKQQLKVANLILWAATLQVLAIPQHTSKGNGL